MNPGLKKRVAAVEAKTIKRRPPPLRVVTVSVTGERRYGPLIYPGKPR